MLRGIAASAQSPSMPGMASMPTGMVMLKVPAHWHPADEHVTVISGMFYAGHGNKLSEAESKAFPPGGFFIATAKMPHFAWSKEETVIQVHPADDPRMKK